MTITCELGATAANALATESCLRSPPSTTITSSRYAGGFAASSEGSATTTSSKGYPVRNVSTVRLRMGTPASNSNCLGCAPSNREPRPPAAMMAETCTNSILARWPTPHYNSRAASRQPVYCRIRSDVTSITRVNRAASTSRGANTTSSPRVVAVVTIVLAESDVGLPKGPAASTSAMRPPTCTSSLRMPGYDSPSRPIRSVTSPSMCAASYRPYGSWNSNEHQLQTSTIELMRGSVSPLRTRRSSASDDGRVLVGSIPTRLYIVRTAVVSAGGLMRTAASAAASGASIR